MDAWLTNPDTDSAIVPASALTGLEEAVRADLAEGTLGRRYLLENRDRLENCYYNDLYLEFRPAGRTGGEEEDGYTVCITLQSGARHTLAVLQACGLDGTLVTQAQIQKEDAVYAQSTTGRGLRQGRAVRQKPEPPGFVFLKNLPLPIYQWLIF